MDKDRQIVLMLLKRVRTNHLHHKNLLELVRQARTPLHMALEQEAWEVCIESRNAAELARRILYTGTSELVKENKE